MDYLSAKSLFKWIIGFLFVLQARYHNPNSAIDLLIKFMLAIFSVLGCFSPFVCTLRKLFPSSLHVMRTHFANEITSFKYPVCPKCDKIYYTYESCIETVGDKNQVRGVTTYTFRIILTSQCVVSAMPCFKKVCSLCLDEQFYTHSNFIVIVV